MSKKQRVKGKGADIFFSEDQGERAVAVSRKASVNSLPRLEETEEQSEELATKATFYFTQSQLDALEKAVFVLRQEHRIKTNKSEVIRIALDELIKEFEENQKESALLKRLA